MNIRAVEELGALPSSLRPTVSSDPGRALSSRDEALRAAAVFMGQEGGLEESSTLWISNLDETVTEEDLRRLLRAKCTGLKDVGSLRQLLLLKVVLFRLKAPCWQSLLRRSD